MINTERNCGLIGAKNEASLEFDYVTNASVDPFIDIFRAELKLRKNIGIGNDNTRQSWKDGSADN